MTKYIDYANVFFFNLVIELTKNIGINKHTIKLVEDKQPPNRSIYALTSVKLETLKTYIKTYLKIGFIQSSKPLTGNLILFNKKLDNSFHLYVDY